MHPIKFSQGQRGRSGPLFHWQSQTLSSSMVFSTIWLWSLQRFILMFYRRPKLIKRTKYNKLKQKNILTCLKCSCELTPQPTWYIKNNRLHKKAFVHADDTRCQRLLEWATPGERWIFTASIGLRWCQTFLDGVIIQNTLLTKNSWKFQRDFHFLLLNTSGAKTNLNAGG